MFAYYQHIKNVKLTNIGNHKTISAVSLAFENLLFNLDRCPEQTEGALPVYFSMQF